MAKLLHIFYHKEGTFSLLCQQVQYFTLSSLGMPAEEKTPAELSKLPFEKIHYEKF